MLKGKGGGSHTTVVGRVSIGEVKLPGDILVTRMTEPTMVRHMARAGAVVTDEGGAMCHAALICTEMGLAYVVGTKSATRDLKDGMVVSVDPVKGTVEIIDEPTE